MKWQRITSLISIMLILLINAGCAHSSNNTGTPLSLQPTMSINTTTVNSTPTSIPTPKFTPTVIPTLSVRQADQRFFELLANNGDCSLPCLWGIMPGQTTDLGAQTVLIPLTSISSLIDFRRDGGTISINYTDDNLILATDVSYLTRNQIVSRIAFHGRIFQSKLGDSSAVQPIFDSLIFSERFRPYMLPQILSEQGIPANVLLSTGGEPKNEPNVPGFYMLLFYPDQGLLVSYTTSRTVVGGSVRGCFASAEVELELFLPGNADSFSDYLAPTKWSGMWPIPVDNPYWKPIEKATSLTLEQFYETFRQPTDKCIETPANLWPTPIP